MARRTDDLLRLEVDLSDASAIGSHQRLARSSRQNDRDEADLEAVRGEDVAERRRDHDLEAVVLSAQAACSREEPQPKFASGEQDLGARAVGPFSSKSGSLHPVEEEELAEAGALDPLQELLRDDLIRVDVRAVEHGRAGR